MISHDLAVVKYLADRIGVMYLGKLVELGPSAIIYEHPAHPYTDALSRRSLCPTPATSGPRRVRSQRRTAEPSIPLRGAGLGPGARAPGTYAQKRNR